MNREEVWKMSIDELEEAVVKEVLKGELKHQDLWIDGELMRDEFYPTVILSDAWTVVRTMTRGDSDSRKARNQFYNFLISIDNQGFWEKTEEDAAFALCAYALIAVREAS